MEVILSNPILKKDKTSKTEQARGFLYINSEDRDLIPVYGNNKIRIKINGNITEHTFDKYGRIFGLTSWFQSNKVRSMTPILIIIKDNFIELKLELEFDEKIEQRIKMLVLEILEMLPDDGDIMYFSDIKNLWDSFQNSGDLTLSQLKFYMNREKKVKKNSIVCAKFDKEGIKKKKKKILKLESLIILVISILSGILSGLFL